MMDVRLISHVTNISVTGEIVPQKMNKCKLVVQSVADDDCTMCTVLQLAGFITVTDGARHS